MNEGHAVGEAKISPDGHVYQEMPDDASSKVITFERAIVDAVRANPLIALLGAVAVGFVLGQSTRFRS